MREIERFYVAGKPVSGLNARYIANGSPLGAPKKLQVKGDESSPRRAADQVDCVGELDSMGKSESSCDGGFILGVYIRKPQEFRERLANGRFFESVRTAQHPGGFEQYGLCDPNRTPFKQTFGRIRLFGVVGG